MPDSVNHRPTGRGRKAPARSPEQRDQEQRNQEQEQVSLDQQTTARRRLRGHLTLAIDIGGSHLKCGVIAVTGQMVMGPERVVTPDPAAPRAVVDALAELAQKLTPFDRISIGFPGVVRDGLILTAPNLGTDLWHGFALAVALSDRLGKPARLLNDATVQGLGAIAARGVECVITLGTGMGFALFRNGKPAPHLEFSQHPIHGRKTYDHYIGDEARRAAGNQRWNKRVHRAIGLIDTVVNYDTLYIGGGNARHINFELPANVQIVSNEAGITGGVRLWDARLDDVFTDPSARSPAPQRPA